MVRDTLYSERGNDIKYAYLVVSLCAPCLFMQESVAGGRQCVAVSLELVGSLVESYQHSLSDVSSRLPLQ